MVTDWWKFAAGGYFSYAYADLLHIPISSEVISFLCFFFVNWVLLKCTDSPKGISIFFLLSKADSRHECLCSCHYLKSCLESGRMAAHLNHSHSCTAPLYAELFFVGWPLKPHSLKEKCEPHRNLPCSGWLMKACVHFCRAWQAASTALKRPAFVENEYNSLYNPSLRARVPTCNCS